MGTRAGGFIRAAVTSCRLEADWGAQSLGQPAEGQQWGGGARGQDGWCPHKDTQGWVGGQGDCVDLTLDHRTWRQLNQPKETRVVNWLPGEMVRVRGGMGTLGGDRMAGRDGAVLVFRGC